MKKETKFWIYSFALVGVLFMLSISCSKKNDSSNSTPPGTVKDADGNIYHTVTIGKQVWMVENLKTTKFNDGTSIPMVGGIEWRDLSTPGYCWYNNDAGTYKATYGAMYNWYAVNTGKLCPTGWHVPTDDEWSILTTYLGGDTAVGGKLKETGTSHWQSPNTGATNETGFTALPGGFRPTAANFCDIGNSGRWWSSTMDPYVYENVWERIISYNYIEVSRVEDLKQYGLSVRCLKN